MLNCKKIILLTSSSNSEQNVNVNYATIAAHKLIATLSLYTPQLHGLLSAQLILLIHIIAERIGFHCVRTYVHAGHS